MTHRNSQFSILNFQLSILLALFLVSCKSHHYVLQSVQPHRIEVTKALDSNPVAAATDFLKPYLAGVDSLRKPYMGQSEQYMVGGRPESLLSNWVADALVATSERMGYHPDLGICNVGGLRAAMPKGTVTRGDVMAITPFNNYLTILTMRGSDVEATFADIAAAGGEGLSASVRLQITRDGRLKTATIGGQPIKADSLYTIATLDYLADGNDRIYSLKKAVKREVTKNLIRDVVMGHLRWLDQNGQKASAQIEGRIVVLNEGIAPQQPVLTGSDQVAGQEQTLQLARMGATPAKSLLVVHTNDTHSCIEPLNPLVAASANADKGGYLRRVALLQQLRANDPDLLLVDAGDFSQGSAFYNLYCGEVEVGLMNIMGYDAATIGNHEFDSGMENLARLCRMAHFPIVCCNYDFTGTPVEGLVKPYTIIQRAGLKIGILGVSPELEGLVSASTRQGVVYNNPIQCAKRVADYLRYTEHCDLIVCLSHLGWMEEGISDEELIAGSRNIDLVIGGHSHTYFHAPQLLHNTDGFAVPDNQMGRNARFVGTLRLQFTQK